MTKLAAELDVPFEWTEMTFLQVQAGNVAFLIYACTLHLAPIVILHGALIPVNVSRLMAAWRAESANLAKPKLTVRS